MVKKKISEKKSRSFTLSLTKSTKDSGSVMSSLASSVDSSNSWTVDEDDSKLLDLQESTTEDSNLDFIDGVIHNLQSMLNKTCEIGRSDSGEDDYTAKGEDTRDVLSPLSTNAEEMGFWQSTMKAHQQLEDLVFGSSSEEEDDSTIYSNDFSQFTEYTSDFYANSYDNDEDEENAYHENTCLRRGKATSNEVAYDADDAKLYRAIDTKKWEAAQRLVKKNPEMAKNWVYRQNNETGEIMWMFLPIHAACFSHAPVSLLRELIRVYPEATGMPCQGKKLALHVACETGAPVEIIQTLVNANHQAVYHVDRNGNTPLQSAMFANDGKNKARVLKVLTKASGSNKTMGSPLKNIRRGFMGKGKAAKQSL